MYYHLLYNSDAYSWYILRKNRVLTHKQVVRLFTIICRKLNIAVSSPYLKVEPERAILVTIIRLLDLWKSCDRITSIDFNNDLKYVVTYE